MTEPGRPQEIERKFRADPDALPFQLANQPYRVIEQGYLAVSESAAREVRVRNSDGNYTLTAKIGGGSVRGEGEITLSEAQFQVLWPFTEGRQIRKTRYEIALGELMAELDIYAGEHEHEGLAVVEVEFPDENAARNFDPPDWFGEEVTENAAYKNQQLALSSQ